MSNIQHAQSGVMRAALTAVYAACIGLILTLLLFIAGVAIAITSNHDTHIPGVLLYTQSADQMSLVTSNYLPFTFLLVSLVIGTPLGLRLTRRRKSS